MSSASPRSGSASSGASPPATRTARAWRRSWPRRRCSPRRARGTSDDVATPVGARHGGGRRDPGRPPCPDRRAPAPRTIVPRSSRSSGAAGLLGRGGAGFPVARKWASVAERGGGERDRPGQRRRGRAAVGQGPRAHDRPAAPRPRRRRAGGRRRRRTTHRPVRRRRARARDRRARLGAARSGAPCGGKGASRIPVELVTPPRSYIAGEESAAVHFVNEGDPRPTSTPPRPFERGVDGRPTLVQNVESLAHAALIARFGDRWYREAGRGETRGTALFTVRGAPQSGVVELEMGTTLAEVAAIAGAQTPSADPSCSAATSGAGWRAPRPGRRPSTRWSSGEPVAPFGCGVVSFLDARSCGVRVTAQILDFMAGSSAAQCGPCVFGLRAIADATARLAYGPARDDDLQRLMGWSETLAGRGACRHPGRRRGPRAERDPGLRCGVRPPPAEPPVHQRRAPLEAA